MQNMVNIWGEYWKHDSAQTGFAITNPVYAEKLAAMWSQFFDVQFSTRTGSSQVLDIASGVGLVSAIGAKQCEGAAGNEGSAFFCADIALSSLTALKNTHPALIPVQCDAADLPFSDGSFDLLVSQFGVEYAGFDALADAARLLRPGGAAKFIIHYRDGGIFQECSDLRDAAKSIRESKVLEQARTTIKAAFAVDRGELEQSAFDEEDNELKKCISNFENSIRGWKTKTGAEFLVKMHSDIATTYSRRANIPEAEIVKWFEKTAGELSVFEGRMVAMTSAAISETELKKITDSWKEAGVSQVDVEPIYLADNNQPPTAWSLSCQR